VQAIEIAHGAKRVDLAAVDQRRGTRPAGVGDRVSAGVIPRPDDLPGPVVEAVDALLAGQLAACEAAVGHLDAPVGEPVGDVDAAAGDGGAGVAQRDGGAPADLRAAGGELIEDAALAPDGAAPRAEPLRPVVAVHRAGARGEKSKESDENRTSGP